MFIIATSFGSISPNVHMTSFPRVAWETFFWAVKNNRPATVVFQVGECPAYRVEFEDGNFKFSAN